MTLASTITDMALKETSQKNGKAIIEDERFPE